MPHYRRWCNCGPCTSCEHAAALHHQHSLQQSLLSRPQWRAADQMKQTRTDNKHQTPTSKRMN